MYGLHARQELRAHDRKHGGRGVRALGPRARQEPRIYRGFLARINALARVESSGRARSRPESAGS
jgi:hypothetical protein